jgi:solute carrier family 35 protein F5
VCWLVGAAAVVEWGLKETARLASVLCPLWFLMNYLFNLSLTLTSIASTTILSSTSGLFVVLLGVVCLKERLALANLVGVCCTIAGAVLVSVRDYWEVSDTHSAGKQQTESLHGDIICCISAMFYASYTVYARLSFPHTHTRTCGVCLCAHSHSFVVCSDCDGRGHVNVCFGWLCAVT